jgi:peptidoglycan/LPS O-acetylase OafA/YrhL
VKTSRQLEFDVLRVSAMLFIVGFFHLFAYFDQLRGIVILPLIDMLSRVALGAFVFISGYFLASRSTIASWKDVRVFLNRRFLRVYPLFFLTLVGFLVTHYIGLHLFIEGALLLTMLTTHYISTLWFVNMLFLFYLVTPLYLWKNSVLKTVLLTALFYGGLILVHNVTGRIDLRLPMYLVIFAVGIVMAGEQKLWSTYTNPWLTMGGVVLFAAVMHFVLPVRLYVQPKTTTEIVWVALIILGVLPFLINLSRFVAPFVPVKPLLFFSNASFAMYLLHRLTYRPMLRLYKPHDVTHELLYSYCIMVPVTFLLAAGVQKAYDALLNTPSRAKTN